MLEPHEEAACFDEFLHLKRYLPFLDERRIKDLHSLWRQDQKLLTADQRALVFAAIGFGAHVRWRHAVDPTMKYLWTAYHLMAIYELDSCAKPSLCALGECVAGLGI